LSNVNHYLAPLHIKLKHHSFNNNNNYYCNKFRWSVNTDVRLCTFATSVLFMHLLTQHNMCAAISGTDIHKDAPANVLAFMYPTKLAKSDKRDCNGKYNSASSHNTVKATRANCSQRQLDCDITHTHNRFRARCITPLKHKANFTLSGSSNSNNLILQQPKARIKWYKKSITMHVSTTTQLFATVLFI